MPRVTRGRLSICTLAVVGAPFAAGCGGDSTASTESTAAKQRVVITAKMSEGTAVLELMRDGALERDSGTVAPADGSNAYTSNPDRTVTRDGQKVVIYTGVWAFTGKHGTLLFRDRNGWVDVGNDGDGDGRNDSVAVGTWKVVLGTDGYAGVRGGGRSSHEGLGFRWYARYEGFLTLP